MADWKVREITDECAHDGKKDQAVKVYEYGTAYCPMCTASKGPDGRWRVLEETS